MIDLLKADSFDKISPYLKVCDNWDFEMEEFISDYTSLYYYDMNHDKAGSLFKKYKLQALQTWICTDETVGRYVLSIDNKPILTQSKDCRKGNIFFTIHDEELFKQFVVDVKDCFDDKKLEGFDTEPFNALNLAWVVDYPFNNSKLFIDDDLIIRKIVEMKRSETGHYNSIVTYLIDGVMTTIDTDIRCSVISYVFDGLDETIFIEQVKDKSIFDVLGDKIYRQDGSLILNKADL